MPRVHDDGTSFRNGNNCNVSLHLQSQYSLISRSPTPPLLLLLLLPKLSFSSEGSDAPSAVAQMTSSYAEELDLTTPSTPTIPTTPSSPMGYTKHSHRTFNSAYRRITHRERLVSPRHPHLLAERTHTTEEAPLPAHRERALLHVSRAYAAAAYAHSALLILLAFLLATAAFFFSRAVAGDILRKTRLRVDDIVTDALQCSKNLRTNGCVIDGDLVTHPTPALEALCSNWLACERRANHAWTDAASASVWAETLAETVNSFTNRISSTTVLIAVIVALFAAFFVTSTAFGFLHRRVVDDRVVKVPRIRDDDSYMPFPQNRPRAITHGASPARTPLR